MIPQQTPVKNHWGNNSTTTFDFDFYIENEEQLTVTHTDFDGNITNPVLGVDYTVTSVGNANGSSITFPIAGSTYSVLGWNESTGEKELLSIALDLPIEQPAEYSMSGDLNKKNLEKSLDYLTRLIQILKRKFSRAMTVPEGSSITNLDLPQPIANNVFKWNDDCTKIVNYDIDSVVEGISTTASSAVSTADNAVSIANSAVSTANSAVSTAESAVSTANDAVSTANSAVSTAGQAESTAGNAVSIAQSAVSTAESAVSTAQSAVSTAESAVSTANEAKDIAEGAESTALSSKERVDEFDATISTVIEAAEQIEELQSAIDDAIEAAEAAQQAAASLSVDDTLSDSSEQPVQNKVIKAALDDKQDELVSGTNIKTVGNQSLVGSGNLDIKTVGNQSIIGSGNIDLKTVGNQSIIGSGNVDIKTVDSQSIMGSGNVDINNIIEQNSNEKTKLWVGTYSQYQLLGNQYFGWDNTRTVFTKTLTPDETTQFYDSSADEVSAVCSSFYAWKYDSIVVYTKSTTPAVGDFISYYNSNTVVISNVAITSVAADSISDGTLTYTRDTSSDLIQTNETIYCTLSSADVYDKVTRYSTADFTDGDAAYDANTIYICIDTGAIYKGTTLIVVPQAAKVSKSGDTMTGSLSIQAHESGTNDNAFIHLTDSSFVKGTTGTGSTYITLELNDSTNNITDYLKTRLGCLETSIDTDGKVTTRISAYHNEIDSNLSSSLSASVTTDGAKSANLAGVLTVTVAADGTTKTSTTVTPAASSNSTNIATTAWVKTYGSTSGSNYLSSFSQAAKGYYAFRNGLIINWGQTSFASGGTEVSFAKAFTTTNYQVVCTAHTTTSTTHTLGALVESKSTTKFKAHGYKAGATADVSNYWIAIGY